MDTPNVPATGASPANDRSDRNRVLRAFNLSLGFVLLLVAVFAVQSSGWDWRTWSVAPLEDTGLWGLLGLSLIHI